MFGTLYAFTLLGLLLQLLGDLVFTWIDPRIDFNRREG
jgi:microcin C transport system permease protein